MRPWLRNGIIFGVAAGVATILVNVLGSLNRPADICAPPRGNLALTLTGLILYVLIAGGAGWQTTRAGAPVSRGALAGLVTGAVSGVPVLVGILLSLDLAVNVAHCPGTTTPPSDDVIRAIGVILALVIVAIGMGVGAAAGAAGGAIGERRDTA